MCLSTVYRGEVKRENILCADVALIESRGEVLVLTDLFGRVVEVEGKLLRADLTGGTVIVGE